MSKWTPWNPAVGCRRQPISAGCLNCWARTMLQPGRALAKQGYGHEAIGPDGRWTGAVEEHPERLAEPQHWRKPRMVAVCWLGDICHIAFYATHYARAIMDAMQVAPHHRYLLLTKAPELYPCLLEDRAPAPHLWLGATACNEADCARVNPPMAALAADGWNTYLFAEPLLGNVTVWPGCKAVMAGGEKGEGARECPIEAFLKVDRDTADMDIPLWWKQRGSHPANVHIPLAMESTYRDFRARIMEGGR